MGRHIFCDDRWLGGYRWFTLCDEPTLDERLAEWYAPDERAEATRELLEGSPFTRPLGPHRDADLTASGLPLIGTRRLFPSC